MTDHYSEQREADEIWNNAPEGAEFYADGCFWRDGDCRWFTTSRTWQGSEFIVAENYQDYSVRPQTHTKPHQNEPVPLKPQNPYQRTIIGLDGSKCVCDVYRVLEAFEVDSHAIAHSIKKLLAPGKRHAKTREQDLREAIASIEAELLLMNQR